MSDYRLLGASGFGVLLLFVYTIDKRQMNFYMSNFKTDTSCKAFLRVFMIKTSNPGVESHSRQVSLGHLKMTRTTNIGGNSGPADIYHFKPNL